MAHAVKFHPSLSLLEQYTEGTLAAELSLVVAAHLDFCPHCQQLRHDIEADIGCQLAQQKAVNADGAEWQQMLQQILSPDASQVTAATTAPETFATHIEQGQHRIEIPRSLQRLAAKRKKWLQLGGIATAKLPSGDDNHLSLLLIESNTEVPLHTHKGLEITLVLAGEMVDEMGKYAAGDLIINTPDHTHTPKNISNEPCLCLSVLTAPLEFKQGLTRLLNPLQRFFY
ncbi:cupin domain-containing protein [Rheinheimera riviphila]|uniref:Cupin domain-containing protein n=1 Tax=Rheinheimera riviphila TaxID=1834037 RepID=A0A437QT28_9GAMM|nr:ChrR family anti-sigma-E factor [Rheinheimera riviphila]RVU37656.1 cupin domain-containing protein [Rheinheimera riviphila]